MAKEVTPHKKKNRTKRVTLSAQVLDLYQKGIKSDGEVGVSWRKG